MTFKSAQSANLVAFFTLLCDHAPAAFVNRVCLLICESPAVKYPFFAFNHPSAVFLYLSDALMYFSCCYYLSFCIISCHAAVFICLSVVFKYPFAVFFMLLHLDSNSLLNPGYRNIL
jgi:hypothetical protein